MNKIKKQVQNYQPFNEQESADREIFLNWLNTEQNILTRNNTVAHITASAWVISPDRNYVLMAYHNIYDSWSWLGGHADGNPDLLEVALKEAKEESGIEAVYPLSKDIFSLEILTVDGHTKRGKYIPSHLHLNVSYLFEADMNQRLLVNQVENSAVEWIKVTDIAKKSSEPWFVTRIYSKLMKKVEQLWVNSDYTK